MPRSQQVPSGQTAGQAGQQVKVQQLADTKAKKDAVLHEIQQGVLKPIMLTGRRNSNTQRTTQAQQSNQADATYKQQKNAATKAKATGKAQSSQI